MSRTKKSKAPTTFQIKGRPPKGKARANIIVAVYPNGAVGIARAEKGNDLKDLMGDARSDAERDAHDGLYGDADEGNENIAYYQCELVLNKPIVKPIVAPKIAKARTTKLATPAVEEEDEDEDDSDEDEDNEE